MQADPGQTEPARQRQPTEGWSDATAQGHLLIAAWSPPAVHAACALTLPSLLAPGNLGCLERGGPRIAATILCLGSDRARFEASPTFRVFADGRSISWHLVDDLVGLLGDAREAVAAEAFRTAMAHQAGEGRSPAFVLIKAGYVFAEGALIAVTRKLDQGAAAVVVPVPMVGIASVSRHVEAGGTGLMARALVRMALSDATTIESHLHECGGLFGLTPEPGAAAAPSSGRRLWAARPYPVGLRPERCVEPARESLIDAEVVPEFVADEAAVYRPASSDDILILEARSEYVLRQDIASPAQSRATRLASWATPWHLRNLRVPYDLVTEDGWHSEGVAPQVLPGGSGIQALRHPAWLVARGLAAVPAVLGRERRYMSPLDGRYKTARTLIEAVDAEAAIYGGHASALFGPLLSRCFGDALIGTAPRVLRAAKRRQGGRENVLHIFHIDLYTLPVLMTVLTDAVSALTQRRCPTLILVEADDRFGAVHEADREQLRAWCQRIAEAAGTAGGSSRLGMTTLEFFDGHPGFWITSTPPENAEKWQSPGDGSLAAGSRAESELVSHS